MGMFKLAGMRTHSRELQTDLRKIEIAFAALEDKVARLTNTDSTAVTAPQLNLHAPTHADGGNDLITGFDFSWSGLHTWSALGTFNAKLGIGTSTVPHGGVGVGILAIEGPDSSSNGPTVQFTTDSDDFPVLQLFNRAHNNTGIFFDCYFDGSEFKSADQGSNFAIRKVDDMLQFLVENSAAPGVTSDLTRALTIRSQGDIEIGDLTEPGVTGVMRKVDGRQWFFFSNAGSIYDGFIFTSTVDGTSHTRWRNFDGNSTILLLEDDATLTYKGDPDDVYIHESFSPTLTGTWDFSGVTITGTIDGRDISADGAVLDAHVADTEIHSKMPLYVVFGTTEVAFT